MAKYDDPKSVSQADLRQPDASEQKFRLRTTRIHVSPLWISIPTNHEDNATQYFQSPTPTVSTVESSPVKPQVLHGV